MTKVLLATPHMPPTPGGPSTHAMKLMEHFGKEGGGVAPAQATLFNFEKYKSFPSGLRHLLAFFEIFFKSFGTDIILALDGFTVALPSIFVGKILRKKVILRVGGDFVYEQFLYTKEVDLETFYKNFSEYKKLFSWSLYGKYLVQKFTLKMADEIIFNTEWQKNIFNQHYGLEFKNSSPEGGGFRRGPWVVPNPVEPIPKNLFENEKLSEEFENALKQNKFIFTSITRNIPYKNLVRLRKVFDTLPSGEGWGGAKYLETSQGSWESCLKRISLSRAYICASISDISPNQVQEALSLGIPVIISKYTGLTEEIQKQNAGIVVDPFSEEEIKNAILTMCDDEKYFVYKKNAESFVWPQTWNSLFKQYESIFSHPRGSLKH